MNTIDTTQLLINVLRVCEKNMNILNFWNHRFHLTMCWHSQHADGWPKLHGLLSSLLCMVFEASALRNQFTCIIQTLTKNLCWCSTEELNTITVKQCHRIETVFHMGWVMHCSLILKKISLSSSTNKASKERWILPPSEILLVLSH